jgi:hypothetical protein
MNKGVGDAGALRGVRLREPTERIGLAPRGERTSTASACYGGGDIGRDGGSNVVR